METTKKCKDCKKELSLDMFHYSSKPKGILKSYCKDCSYNRTQVHIAKDPLAHHYYMKRYYKENPEKYPGNHYNKKIPAVCGVYIVDCLLTNDSYVGCSTNLRNRKWKHFSNKGHGKNKKLSKLVKELGKEAFDFRVLEYCDKEVMFELETKYIQIIKPNLNNNKNK